MKCSICNKNIKKDPLSGWSGGNNAQPVNNGRCCSDCNIHIVIPMRLMRLKKIIGDVIFDGYREERK